MSDEERKKLQEKNINKLNPYKDRVKKYFPNGGEICTEGRKKGTKIVRKTTQISRNALTWALEGHSTKIRMALDSLFAENPEAYINAVSKLLNYTVPKLSSSEINDNTTKKVKIELNDDVSIEDLRAKIDEIDNN
jgi:hypothetical protein|tara:strand:+ start:68 stop:472 length:405 start_codon:yes stop_codon:yes gene_type:complete